MNSKHTHPTHNPSHGYLVITHMLEKINQHAIKLIRVLSKLRYMFQNAIMNFGNRRCTNQAFNRQFRELDVGCFQENRSYCIFLLNYSYSHWRKSFLDVGCRVRTVKVARSLAENTLYFSQSLNELICSSRYRIKSFALFFALKHRMRNPQRNQSSNYDRSKRDRWIYPPGIRLSSCKDQVELTHDHLAFL